MSYRFTPEMIAYYNGECQGDGWAAYKLSCEMDKKGVDEVFVQNHCRKAAELGCATAYVMLGVYALRGSLLEDYSVMDDKHYQKKSRSIELFKTASSMGNCYGKFMYGQCLLNGIFTKCDEDYARTLIEEAVPYISEEDVISMVTEIHKYLSKSEFNHMPPASMAMKEPMSSSEDKSGPGLKKAS